MVCLVVLDIKCPVCHKTVPPDSVEIHLVMCLTKPHIVYNGKFSKLQCWTADVQSTQYFIHVSQSFLVLISIFLV